MGVFSHHWSPKEQNLQNSTQLRSRKGLLQRRYHQEFVGLLYINTSLALQNEVNPGHVQTI